MKFYGIFVFLAVIFLTSEVHGFPVPKRYAKIFKMKLKKTQKNIINFLFLICSKFFYTYYSTMV